MARKRTLTLIWRSAAMKNSKEKVHFMKLIGIGVSEGVCVSGRNLVQQTRRQSSSIYTTCKTPLQNPGDVIR